MRILLDACVWGPAKAELEDLGHQVEWVGDWPGSPSDEDVISRAYLDGRLVATLDNDFGELAVRHQRPHHGIVRLVGVSATAQARTIHEVVSTHEAELRSSALITVEAGRRLRVRLGSSP